MTRSRVLWVLSALTLLACESATEKANEKAAHELLDKAKYGQRQDAPTSVLGYLEVGMKYPGTKAAAEASQISDTMIAERKNKEEAVAARLSSARPSLAQLRAKHDDMKEVTWYTDPASEKWVLGKWVKFYFGIGADKGKPTLYPLRAKFQWEGSSWIFAQTLTIRTGDKIHRLTAPITSPEPRSRSA